MRLLFQKSLRSGTRNLDNGKIEAEAVLLSTDSEMVARIVAANDSFLIEQAEWESLRSGSHYLSSGESAAQLIGAQAFFGIAASLARAFPAEEQAVQRSLFAECIKAVIQSECYLVHKRGFLDKDSYQKNWDLSHPNSCRYYSHLDLVSRRWFGYIGEETRARHLFHRHKNVSVWLTDRGIMHATGSFIDSFHELGIRAECAGDGRIIEIKGSFLRAPDSICFGTDNLLGSLSGLNLADITRRDMNRCVGGPEGCAHLLDLSQDVLAGLQEAIELFDSAK